MKLRITLLTLVSLAFCIAPVSFAEEEPLVPDGFVWFSKKDLGIILGGSKGGGHLKYGNDDHTFRVTGLKLGTIGPAEVKASGEVYNLKKLEDFAGTYRESSIGLTVIVGQGGIWLENEQGVKMNLRTSQVGANLTVAGGGLKIKLGMVDK
jgi:hypothetical protein